MRGGSHFSYPGMAAEQPPSIAKTGRSLSERKTQEELIEYARAKIANGITITCSAQDLRVHFNRAEKIQEALTKKFLSETRDIEERLVDIQDFYNQQSQMTAQQVSDAVLVGAPTRLPVEMTGDFVHGNTLLDHIRLKLFGHTYLFDITQNIKEQIEST